MSYLQSMMNGEDPNEHSDSTDPWGGISNRSTRDAYYKRVMSWVLRIYCGFGGMPTITEGKSPLLPEAATLLRLPKLQDKDVSQSQRKELLWKRAKGVLGPLRGYDVAYAGRWGHPEDGASQSSTEAQAPSGEDERQANWPVGDCAMRRNIEWLSECAGLNETEHTIFEFAVAMRVFAPLKSAVTLWGDMNFGDLPYALSAVLNIPFDDAAAACSQKSALWTSGLVRINRFVDEHFSAMLFVSRTLSDNIVHHRGPPEEILGHMAQPLTGANLTLADFAHVERHTRLAQSWLYGVMAAAARQEVAGHMLVTGKPGLGKTEWVAALLLESQANTFAMVAVNDLGVALSGEDRLTHLRVVMRMMRSTERGVILFDESDDVFRPPTGLGASGGGGGDKDSVSMDNHRASMNRLLEDSRIPVVWIMNKPEVLDPAVRRRFDVEIHFEGMPESVRLTLIQARFKHRMESANDATFDAILDTSARGAAGQKELDEQKRWGRVETLTPALIDRLGRVSERAQLAGFPMDETMCRHWLLQRLPGRATRHLRIRAATNADPVPVYDANAWSPDSVNASVDLMELVEGIKRNGNARIALCGAPGTGKTAFAKALARMLDKPLLERRASDLLSAYVGETEQRINEAFEQAGEEDAVLFIDEVDGLLANRQHAVRNWEVTQVNELLEQLGEFDGVVVVATNRLDAIDPAALRRLDIKIQFDPLKPAQIRTGFESLCKALNLAFDEKDLRKVAALSGVTPGDFACIARRLGFAKVPANAGGLIALLEEELALKDPIKQPMGFVGQAGGGSSSSGSSAAGSSNPNAG